MVRLEGLKSVNALSGQYGNSLEKGSNGKLRINAGKLLLAYLTGGVGAEGAAATEVGTTAATATKAGEAMAAAEAAKTATLGQQVAAAESAYIAPAAQLSQASALSDTLQQLGKYKEMIQQGPQSILGNLLGAGAEATSSGGLVNDTLNETFKLLKSGIESYTPPPRRRR